MLGGDGLGAVEIGDRSRDLQDTVVASGREAEPVHGSGEEAFGVAWNPAIPPDLAGAQLCIHADRSAPQALALALTCGLHPRSDDDGRLAGWSAEVGMAECRQLDL